jgi:hypothetical protein
LARTSWDTAFVVGTDNKKTTYVATAMTPEGGGTKITLRHGADFYRSKVEEVAPDGTVTAVLEFPCGQKQGMDKDWVASNEAQTRFWRAEYLGGSQFKLNGPVAKEDFGPEGVLRLWEYGVGDEVRQAAWAAVRRTEPGVYEVTGNANVNLVLKANALSVSTDRMAWKGIRGGSVAIGADELSAGPVFLRVE